ncbi:MAG TPA: hypothetical protein VM122_02130 [Usitatibacter sp.]|nr:hypothetical protein [Usitatibacter sp.]
MNSKPIHSLVIAALALASGAAVAQPRYADDYSFRAGRAPDWNVASADGMCRLRVYVDDKAQVSVRGDQILVRTESGQRSYDQGSVCTQPLPFGPVDNFRVTLESGRGSIHDVVPPNRRNNYTAAMRIDDPDRAGDTYEMVLAWRNPGGPASVPLASNDAYPHFDEARACQDRVRADFLSRNRDGDAYLEFAGTTDREDVGPNRERIRGEAFARSRLESRPLSYECVLNERTNRVVTSSYEMRARGRYSSLR